MATDQLGAMINTTTNTAVAGLAAHLTTTNTRMRNRRGERIRRAIAKTMVSEVELTNIEITEHITTQNHLHNNNNFKRQTLVASKVIEI